jgi:hypothetical protein
MALVRDSQIQKLALQTFTIRTHNQSPLSRVLSEWERLGSAAPCHHSAYVLSIGERSSQ